MPGGCRAAARELSSKTNDNPAAILLIYGTARVLRAGDAETKEGEHVAEGSYTERLAVINVPKLHTL